MTTPLERRLLLVAFLFPPVGGTGLPGSQRAVKFVKYLENYRISVLTAREQCYPSSLSLNFERPLPASVQSVTRTPYRSPFASLVAARAFLRRLLYRGGSPSRPAAAPPPPPQPVAGRKSLLQRGLDYVYDLCNFPDESCGWLWPALLAGSRIIRSEGIDVILATGMPWTSLLVAWLLHVLTGVAYVVDFRDPWIGNPFHRSRGRFLDLVESWLERRVVTGALLVCVNTEELRAEVMGRYRGLLKGDRVVVVTNGFDPDDLAAVALPERQPGPEPAPFLELAHAGSLYGPRDPSPLLEAISSMELAGVAAPGALRLVLIGHSNEEHGFRQRYPSLIERGAIRELGILPYNVCLERLEQADVLLLIQQETKSQVPSKLYDYLCLNRPILAVTPPDGALGRLMLENGFGDVFAPDDIEGMSTRLGELLAEKKTKGCLRADYPMRDRFNIRNVLHAFSLTLDGALGEPERGEKVCPPIQR